MSTETGTIVTATGIGSCTVGMVVAHDAINDKYIPATAAWALDSNGAVKPSDAAYIAGVLLTSAVDGTGTLLVRGAIQDSSTIAAMTGNSVSAGQYYLTAGSSGIAQLGVPEGALPVYCGAKINDGLFIFNPCAPEITGHRHTLYPLTSGAWTSVGASTWTYSDDSTASQILTVTPEAAVAVISNGVLDSQSVNGGDGYIISGGGLTVIGPKHSNDVESAYQLSPINRLISTDPEVRAIAPGDGNEIVKVSKVYGTVYIDTTFTVTSTNNVTGTAVTSISNAGITTGPVVQELNAGIGIDISGSEGAYTITNTATASTYLDMQTVNASNVLIGLTADAPMFTFPANMTSKLIGTIRIPASVTNWDIKVFAWILGSSPEFTANVLIQNPPNTSATAAVTPVSATISAVTAADTTITEQVSTAVPNIEAGALVTLEISAAPASGIKLRAIGIKLVPKN